MAVKIVRRVVDISNYIDSGKFDDVVDLVPGLEGAGHWRVLTSLATVDTIKFRRAQVGYVVEVPMLQYVVSPVVADIADLFFRVGASAASVFAEASKIVLSVSHTQYTVSGGPKRMWACYVGVCAFFEKGC